MADTLLLPLKLRLATRSHTMHFLVPAKNDISTLDLRACGKVRNAQGFTPKGRQTLGKRPESRAI